MPSEQSADRAAHTVEEIVLQWRAIADAMEKHIESPSEKEEFIIGFWRARANELEARVLRDRQGLEGGDE